jgi:hypothetical protein
MTKDEALKLALGYVERNCPALVFGEIKEALAQPEQPDSYAALREDIAKWNQRQWVGLTEEEINACDPSEECWGLHKIARAIEAKLKEKNA